MTAPALRLDNVHKSFGATRVITGVTLDIAAGERHAIIGPNGAGKSTLFHLITGRFPASSGRMFLAGEDITGQTSHAIYRRGLARSFQVTSLFARLSVFENLRVGAMRVHGAGYSFWKRLHHYRSLNDRVEEMLEMLGLAARRDVPAGLLVYAEQRALEIGLAIVGGAHTILLDEPTAGMNHAETDRAVALIRKVTEGRTLVMVEHDMGVVFDLADRITVLSDGRVIACGSPDEVRGDPAVRTAYLGAAAEVPDVNEPVLRVQGLNAWYGKSQVLRGVDMTVGRGEIVGLLGRNGAGRSTTLKAIMGAVQREGQVVFDGRDISTQQPHEIARAGIGYVAEDRSIFPDLNTQQNLILGEKKGPGGRFGLEDVYGLFPRLRERATAPAGALSGGEQQMLAICRTLMGNPSLVMVDEPTEGLAPMMVEAVRDLLERVASSGTMILLVEQKLAIALAISRRLYVMGHGRIVFEGTPADLAADAAVRKEWLEV